MHKKILFFLILLIFFSCGKKNLIKTSDIIKTIQVSNWEKAKSLIKHLIDQEDKDIYFLASVIYYNAGNLQKANLYINKAIEIDTKNSEFYYFKGLSLYKEHKYEEAIKTLTKALDINPDNLQIIYLIIDCKYAISKSLKEFFAKTPEIHYLESLRDNPNAIIISALKVVFWTKDKVYIEQAIRRLHKVRLFDGYYSLAYLNIAIIQDRFLNNKKLAIKYYKRVLKKASFSEIQKENIRKRISFIKKKIGG